MTCYLRLVPKDSLHFGCKTYIVTRNIKSETKSSKIQQQAIISNPWSWQVRLFQLKANWKAKTNLAVKANSFQSTSHQSFGLSSDQLRWLLFLETGCTWSKLSFTVSCDLGLFMFSMKLIFTRPSYKRMWKSRPFPGSCLSPENIWRNKVFLNVLEMFTFDQIDYQQLLWSAVRRYSRLNVP